MDASLKAGIEKAFTKATSLRGTAIERDGCVWVEVAIADCGPGAEWHRTFEVEPLQGVEFKFSEI